MPTYVALLRAVNVGGTGRLPMADLRALCEAAGFRRVRTYIASGNVVLEADGTEGEVKAALEERLEAWAGRPVGVLVRTGAELGRVLSGNPFPDADPRQSVAIFLDAPPGADALQDATGQGPERMRLGERVIYVDYVSGIGRSKLKIPAARTGTARNMNTVAVLAAMAGEAPRGA